MNRLQKAAAALGTAAVLGTGSAACAPAHHTHYVVVHHHRVDHPTWVHGHVVHHYHYVVVRPKPVHRHGLFSRLRSRSFSSRTGSRFGFHGFRSGRH